MQIEIGVIGAVVGFLISYFGLMRNRDKDVKSDSAEQAVVRTKLDSIGQGVDSIRVDLKVHERNFSDLTGRVIRVEESAKQAHRRIDAVEERVDAK